MNQAEVQQIAQSVQNGAKGVSGGIAPLNANSQIDYKYISAAIATGGVGFLGKADSSTSPSTPTAPVVYVTSNTTTGSLTYTNFKNASNVALVLEKNKSAFLVWDSVNKWQFVELPSGVDADSVNAFIQAKIGVAGGAGAYEDVLKLSANSSGAKQYFSGTSSLFTNTGKYLSPSTGKLVSSAQTLKSTGFIQVSSGDVITQLGCGDSGTLVIAFYTSNDENTWVSGVSGGSATAMRTYTFVCPQDGYIRSCVSANSLSSAYTNYLCSITASGAQKIYLTLDDLTNINTSISDDSTYTTLSLGTYTASKSIDLAGNVINDSSSSWRVYDSFIEVKKGRIYTILCRGVDGKPNVYLYDSNQTPVKPLYAPTWSAIATLNTFTYRAEADGYIKYAYYFTTGNVPYINMYNRVAVALNSLESDLAGSTYLNKRTNRAMQRSEFIENSFFTGANTYGTPYETDRYDRTPFIRLLPGETITCKLVRGGGTFPCFILFTPGKVYWNSNINSGTTVVVDTLSYTATSDCYVIYQSYKGRAGASDLRNVNVEYTFEVTAPLPTKVERVDDNGRTLGDNLQLYRFHKDEPKYLDEYRLKPANRGWVAAQGLTFVKDEVWCFNGTASSITALTDPINRYDAYTGSAKSNIYHNLGHANSADYCRDNDCVIVGTSNVNKTPDPDLYIIMNCANFRSGTVTTADNTDTTNVCTMKFAKAKYGTNGMTGVWGETKDYMYLIWMNNGYYTSQNALCYITKIIVGYGTNDLSGTTNGGGAYVYTSANNPNGTYQWIKDWQTTSPVGTLQGGAFYQGKVVIPHGISYHQVDFFELGIKDSYARCVKTVRTEPNNADEAEDCAFNGLYMWLSAGGQKIIPIHNRQGGEGTVGTAVVFDFPLNNAQAPINITPLSSTTDLYISARSGTGFTVLSATGGTGKFYWETIVDY